MTHQANVLTDESRQHGFHAGDDRVEIDDRDLKDLAPAEGEELFCSYNLDAVRMRLADRVTVPCRWPIA